MQYTCNCCNYNTKDGSNWNRHARSDTHKELLDKYGTDCFHTSVYLLEDYFDPIDLIRDKKINVILNA